jgi:hypothetical protein
MSRKHCYLEEGDYTVTENADSGSMAGVPRMSLITLGDLPKHYGPQFPHLYNGDENNPQWLVMIMKTWLGQCLVYNKHHAASVGAIILAILICPARGF